MFVSNLLCLFRLRRIRTYRPDSRLDVQSSEQQRCQPFSLQESLQFFAHSHPVSPEDDIRLRRLVLSPLVQVQERIVEFSVPASLDVHVSSVDGLTIGQSNVTLGETWTSRITLTGDEALSAVTVDGGGGQLLELASRHRPI